MKVVVTGGAGFIGAHLTRALLAAGVEVVVIDDLSTGALSNLAGLPAKLVIGSVTDRTLVEEACIGASSIVHLAARPSVERSLLDPMATHEVNATGTLTVLGVAQRAETHVVVISSSSVYGGLSRPGPASPGGATGGPDPATASADPAPAPRPRSEDSPCRPRSPYAASKLAAESYALSYQTSFGLPVLAVRLFNVFGPYQSVGHAYAAVMPTFIQAALAGRALTVHGDGRQTRDFTYVESVAAILSEAVLRRIAHPGPVNLAFGTRTDLLTVIAQLERILGRSLPVQHAAPRAGDVRDSQADTAAMRALFPDVTGVDLADALEATVAWYADSLGVAGTAIPSQPLTPASAGGAGPSRDAGPSRGTGPAGVPGQPGAAGRPGPYPGP